MHSHNRTLLAKLGFADKDKGVPLHDLACQYLTSPEASMSIGEAVVRRRLDDALGQAIERLQESEPRKVGDIKPINFVHEHILSKGDGQYKTTIGFIDDVIL